MPIEIRELHIRVSVNDSQNQSAAPAEVNAKDAGSNPKKLVQQCIEQVFELINSKKER